MNRSYKFNSTQLFQLEKLLNFYSPLNYKKGGYLLFSVKIDGLNFTFYKSGKLLIQGKESESNKFLLREIEKIILDNLEERNYLPLAGSDEAGKGDVFGPLIVAATFVNEDTAKKLKLLGVDDSKKISPQKLKVLAPKVMKLVPYNVVILRPEKYNELYQKLKNLNRILNWAHWRVLTNLKKKVSFQRAVIDDFGMKEKAQRWNQNDLGIELILETKAESKYLPVAAASVIASYYLSQWFEENKFPRGASQVDAIEAALREILERDGEEGIKEFAKMNFSPVQRLL